MEIEKPIPGEIKKDYKYFEEVRTDALAEWLRRRPLHRKIDDKNGQIYLSQQHTFEHRVQHDRQGDKHINILCSMMAYSENITDILTDNRWDQKRFGFDDYNHHFDENCPGILFYPEDDDDVLFRVYTKLWLIASELFEDFIALHQLTLKVSKATSQEFLSPNKTELHQILGFTNRVFKHRDDGFHIANDHLKILFEDSGHLFEFNNPISLTSISKEDFKGEPDSLVIPKMRFIIDILIHGYDKLFGLFSEKENYDKLINSRFSTRVIDRNSELFQRIREMEEKLINWGRKIGISEEELKKRTGRTYWT